MDFTLPKLNVEELKVPCKNCKEPSKILCPECTPDSDERGVSAKITFYCSPECHVADWPNHKSSCEPRRQLRTLQRAAFLSQDLFHTIRNETFKANVETIWLDGSKLNVEFKPTPTGNTTETPPRICNIGPSIFRNAVLQLDGSCTGVVRMRPLLSALLKDLYESVEEFDMTLRNTPFVTLKNHRGKCLVHEFFKNVPCEIIDHYRHMVLKVTLKSGESFALDITGGQFGFHTPVMAWHAYCRKYVFRVHSSHSWDFTSHVCEVVDHAGQFFDSSFRIPDYHTLTDYLVEWLGERSLTLPEVLALEEDDFLMEKNTIIATALSRVVGPAAN